jgi:hypothetical protein
MKKYCLLLVIIFANPVNSDVPPEMKHEIEHLIYFIKNTSCQINRNGQYYDGEKAVAHIQKKYHYFRDKINTTEQFVAYSATKSTMSRKYYMVKCGNQQPEKTKDWLLNELKKYRENRNT